MDTIQRIINTNMVKTPLGENVIGMIAIAEAISLNMRLQQKLVDMTDPSRVADFKAIKVKAGDSVYMPSGYGHLVANVGSTWLVTSDDSPVDGPDDSASMPGHADYELVKKMRGFAFYVIAQSGRPALAANPLYKEVMKTDFGGIPTM